MKRNRKREQPRLNAEAWGLIHQLRQLHGDNTIFAAFDWLREQEANVTREALAEREREEARKAREGR